MYAATRGPNVKWRGIDFKWGGRAPLAPPLATALRAVYKPVKTLYKSWFRIADHDNVTYTQEKRGLEAFYIKRKVLDDLVTTEPLHL